MFCPECGKEIKDGAKFCPYCGSQIGEQKKGSAKESGKKASASFSERVKSIPRNTLIGIIATVVALLVALAIVLGILGTRSKPYEKDIAQMVKYLNEQYAESAETLYKLNDYSSYSADEDWNLKQLRVEYLGEEDYTIDNFLDVYDALSDEFGSDYKITYDIINVQDLSAKDLRTWENNTQDAFGESGSYGKILRRDYRNDIDEMLDNWIYSDMADDDTTTDQLQEFITQADAISNGVIDKYGTAKCTEGYKLRVRFSIEGSLDSATDTQEITVYKFGDSWNVYHDMMDIARGFVSDY